MALAGELRVAGVGDREVLRDPFSGAAVGDGLPVLFRYRFTLVDAFHAVALTRTLPDLRETD